MEDASLTTVDSKIIMSLSTEPDDKASYLANIRDRALKIIYIVIGTVGVFDNLFVILIFIFFIKITDKVYSAVVLILNVVISDRCIKFIKRIRPSWS